MLGIDWVAIGLLAGAVATLVKTLWPKHAQKVDALVPVFETAWKVVEGVATAQKMSPGQKQELYERTVKQELELRKIKPKQWMRDAALHYAKQLSTADHAARMRNVPPGIGKL